MSIQVDAERAGGIVAWMFARKKTGGASARWWKPPLWMPTAA